MRKNGRTDRRRELTKPIVASHNFSTLPTKEISVTEFKCFHSHVFASSCIVTIYIEFKVILFSMVYIE